MITSFKTSVHDGTIELPCNLALPEGHIVEVTIRTCPDVESTEPPPPEWLEHFTVDAAIAPAKIIIKGTRLLAEDVAKLVEEGHSDEDLRRLHPELTADDIDALHHYVKVPATLRRLFGAWADEADELDKCLEELRRLRAIPSRDLGE
ncbi:MAG: DUF433 domain-containing protein [Pirellulales bacterium]